MSGKKPRMQTTFTEAVTHRARIRATLADAGIVAAGFDIVVADTGPRVDVYVKAKDLERTRELLPSGIDPKTVQVVVWIEPAGK